MSVDLNRLTAHLSPQQQADIAKAYHREADHSTTAFLYCFFLGTLGMHRFYLGQWRKGFAHLLLPLLVAAVLVAGFALKWSPLLLVAVAIPLVVIALVWEIIDLFTIDHEVYTRNLKLAEQLIAGSLLSDHSVERRADTKLESMLKATEAQAAMAGTHDRISADSASAAVVSEETQAVAEPAPALVPADAAVVETVGSDTRHDASAALSSDEYVATTTTQISDNPDDAKRAEATQEQPSDSWSETERYHAGALESVGAGESTGDVSALGAAVEEESATEAEATANDFSFDQSLTRSHEASPFSVTDSAELMTTMAVAHSTDDERQMSAEEEAPLSAQEAEAATWPDHDPVRFDEPATDDQPSDISWGATAAVVGSELLSDNSASSGGPDATDMSQYPGAVETIADIEGADAAPLYIALPEESVRPQPFFDATDSALPTDESGAADSAGELEDGLVVFIPDQIDAGADMSAAASTEPTSGYEPPAASYIPPTVPVITTLGAAALEGDSSPAPAFTADQSGPEPSTWQDAPAAEPVASESDASRDETLAEVAGAAAFGVATGAVYESVAHHEDHSSEAASQVSHESAPATPGAPDGQSAAATPEPAPVLPDATAGETTAEAAAETPHHRKRHIRVVRQVKVGGEVIEEMAAEEYIDEDADPEPVRKRLEAMLRQQAGGAIPAANLPEHPGDGVEK